MTLPDVVAVAAAESGVFCSVDDVDSGISVNVVTPSHKHTFISINPWLHVK